MAGGAMKDLIDIYRTAYAAAGHEGQGTVMLAFTTCCVMTISKRPRNSRAGRSTATCARWSIRHRTGLQARSRWIIRAMIRSSRRWRGKPETQVEKCAAWVGTPERILDTIATYQAQIGPFEVASLQVNFNDLPLAAAEASMRLFGESVLPRLA